MNKKTKTVYVVVKVHIEYDDSLESPEEYLGNNCDYNISMDDNQDQMQVMDTMLMDVSEQSPI